jgi:hypothetical protein
MLQRIIKPEICDYRKPVAARARAKTTCRRAAGGSIVKRLTASIISNPPSAGHTVSPTRSSVPASGRPKRHGQA